MEQEQATSLVNKQNFQQLQDFSIHL